MTRFILFTMAIAFASGCNTDTERQLVNNMNRKTLALNDATWQQYATRTGDGRDLAALLQSSSKSDDEYFRIFHECCDLETFDIFPAAYAAFPHLEKIAAESTDPKDAQWPLSICAAICANFKSSHGRNDVPPELWDDFLAAVIRSGQTAATKIQQFPTDDPSFMKFMMIQPILQNIETKSMFGNPQPNSFVLYDWFEERRPEELAR